MGRVNVISSLYNFPLKYKFINLKLYLNSKLIIVSGIVELFYCQLIPLQSITTIIGTKKKGSIHLKKKNLHLIHLSFLMETLNCL